MKASIEHAADVPKLITIKSRLAETIRFPSYGSTSILMHEAEQSSLKQRPSDNIRRFSEMYQWLKEHLNDSTYVDSNVYHTYIGH